MIKGYLYENKSEKVQAKAQNSFSCNRCILFTLVLLVFFPCITLAYFFGFFKDVDVCCGVLYTCPNCGQIFPIKKR